jgi:hypothetical protein
MLGQCVLPGKAMARTGLRMMPTFPSAPPKIRYGEFPRYGFKAGISDKAFPKNLSAVVLRANCFHPILLLCVRDDARVRHVRADPTALARGPWLRSGLCCPGPSSLSLAPLAGTSRLCCLAAYTRCHRCAYSHWPRQPRLVATLSSAGLNLLTNRCPTVWLCPATLVHGKPGYAQNIRSLEYCVCTLGKA